MSFSDSVEGWPATQDLRTWLDARAADGAVGVVRREIDPAFELSGVLSRLDGQSTVYFERVAGSRMPCVGNSITTRADLARALGCASAQTPDRLEHAKRSPRACADATRAPVLEQTVDGDEPLETLPIPTAHARDAGRYLSAGVVVSRDPSSGAQNLSINRLQVVDGACMRALMLSGRMRWILDETEAAGESLELAIVLGADPLLLMATQIRAARDVDELEVASALRERPLELVQAPNVDLLVPAHAEILIEARARRDVRETEGPFGEFPHTYSPAVEGPVLDVVAVHHRERPILQTILSGGREHLLVGGLPREADLLAALHESGAPVKSVRMSEGGSCRFHAVLALSDPGPGQARAALRTALEYNSVLKHAVAVDEDVNLDDAEAIEWALATRVQVSRDLVVMEGVPGSALDPTVGDDERTAKLGIDATIGMSDAEGHRWMQVPGAHDLDIGALVEPYEATT